MQPKKLLLQGKIVHFYQSDILQKQKTLLFLHGWEQDGKSFNKILSLLEEKEVSYISLDLPGFGSTELLSPDMTIEDYGAFVVTFIEKLSLEKPLLIGHSFGGRIALYLGSYYQNISQIVLIGAAGIQTKISFMRKSILTLGKILFQVPGMKNFGTSIKNSLASRDYKNAGKMQQIFKNTISNDLQRYMKKIELDVLMIRGESDAETPLEQGKHMHTLIRNSRFYSLPGSHFVFQEKEKEVTKLILDFM